MKVMEVLYASLFKNVDKRIEKEYTLIDKVFFDLTVMSTDQEEKKEAIAEELLEDMHARTVIKNQDGNLYTVYAYSPCFSESVRQGTTRVNLALTMYYNSRTQQTEICAAVPAIGVSRESA